MLADAGWFDHTVENLAKKDADACMKFIEKWSSEGNDPGAVRFSIPVLLYHTFINDKPRLLDVFKSWVNRREPFRETCLEAMRDMLSNVKDDDPIVGQSRDLLTE